MKNAKAINKIMEFEGRKLGYLLEKSNLRKEEKQGIVLMLEKMSPTQIKNLVDELERQYLDYETKDIDQIFINKLKEL